ncbi:hypothetical protein DXU77_24110, partial [Pseudomonas lactis]|nr:hypothetical protein [Pseudomonas lactis]
EDQDQKQIKSGSLRIVECGARRGHCGSWLACEGIDSVCLNHRVDWIAGKPAPTVIVLYLPSRYALHTAIL